jgi:hypothetical protein
VVSVTHEGLLEVFRDDPTIVLDVLDILGVKVPCEWEVRPEPAELTLPVPAELRADWVASLWDPGRGGLRPERGVIIEVQRRVSEEKVRSLPLYVASLAHRLDCDILLVMLCTSRAAADSFREPLPTHCPGWDLDVLVLGPGEIPIVDDPVVAVERPLMAVCRRSCTAVIGSGVERSSSHSRRLCKYCPQNRPESTLTSCTRLVDRLPGRC